MLAASTGCCSAYCQPRALASANAVATFRFAGLASQSLLTTRPGPRKFSPAFAYGKKLNLSPSTFAGGTSDQPSAATMSAPFAYAWVGLPSVDSSCLTQLGL